MLNKPIHRPAEPIGLSLSLVPTSIRSLNIGSGP